MSAATPILREQISRSGPIPFRRFMETALYAPECGYYRGGRDPFGARGDFYTAEQIQPVFGILMAARVRQLFEEMERPREFAVVELGAGRGEMAEAFSPFPYFPVEIGREEWPERFQGVVFSNEFFDALPVHLAVWRGGRFREMLVDWRDGRFDWVEGDPVSGELKEYLDRYVLSPADGELAEANLEALSWLEEIARRLERGFVLTVDYGYTSRERARFPRGTLISYRRHAADESVLAEPGERDITAHVCFTALEEHGASLGLETLRLEPLSRTLLEAGEPDRFAAALAAPDPREELRRRMQLKTLLYGLGESFRTLLQRRAPPK